MEYTIIQDMNSERFIAMVNEAIQEGWRPLGGMAVSGLWLYQAMVRGEQ